MTALLKSKADELHRVRAFRLRLCLSVRMLTCCVVAVTRAQLASALVEHETLDAEEVQKVIKGESIRAIDEVIKEDLSRMQEEVSAS